MLLSKKPIKVQIFEVLECLDQNSSNSSCQFWTDKSIPLQFLHPFLLSWHITPLKFEGHPFSILDKRILSKTQFWDFQVLWWKFDKYLRSILEAQISVSSNFLSIISDIKHQTPLYFLSWNTLYFWPQAAHQSANFSDFWAFELKFVKFLMSVLEQQVNSSSDFLLFFSLITHNLCKLLALVFSTSDKSIPWK